MQETIRIRTSNKSGERIPEGKGATIRLTVNGKRYRADITTGEMKELVAWLKAEEMKPRKKSAGGRRRKANGGRRRKAAAAAPAAPAAAAPVNAEPVADESANA